MNRSEIYTKNLNWQELFNKIKEPLPTNMFKIKCAECVYRINNVCCVTNPAIYFDKLKECKKHLGFAGRVYNVEPNDTSRQWKSLGEII